MKDNAGFSSSSKKSNEIPIDVGISVIDRLLSSGWTSILDMSIALDEYAREHGYEDNNVYRGTSLIGYYNWLMEAGGLFSGRIRSSYFYRMSEVWTRVHLNSPDPKKKDLFIDAVKIKRDNCEQYNLSEDTLSYLYKGKGVRVLWIYAYKESHYSIIKDLKSYYDLETWHPTTSDYKKIEEKVRFNPSDAIDKYNIAPDPDVIKRKCRALFIKALQDELLNDTTGAVQKRLENIASLREKKPFGWIEEVSSTYLNAIYDGQGIIADLDLGPIIHHYGSYLMDTKEYNQGQTFLEEALKTLRATMLLGNNKAKEEYALILQNLAALHSCTGNYCLAEKEVGESLSIFRELAIDDKAFDYGIAITLNSLAGIHVKMKQYDSVEEEFEESAHLFSKLSDVEPTKYLYMFVECLTSFANYYYLIGKYDDSIKTYEWAMPILDKLSERNFDDFAPQKVIAILNFASALQDVGATDRAETIINEAIWISRQLNSKSPNVFTEELSTALNNRGVLYSEIGKIEQARNDLLEAEKLRRCLAEEDSKAYNYRLAATLDSLANLDLHVGLNCDAIDKWEEALSLLTVYDNNGDNDFSIEIGKYNASIGMAYMASGDYEKAKNYFDRAVDFFRGNFDRNSYPQKFEDIYALTLSYLGTIFSADETLQKEAEVKFEESLDVALWYNANSAVRDKSFLTLVYSNYASFLFDNERFDEAKQMWEQAVKLGEDNLSPQNQELIQLLKENILEAEYRIAHPKEDYSEDDNEIDGDNIQNSPAQWNNSESQYSKEDAIKAIESIANQIRELDKDSLGYREKCGELYKESLKYCSSMPETIYLADFLSSLCEFTAEEYNFSIVKTIAPIALNIYGEILQKDKSNLPISLCYVTLLSVYCQSLDEYSEYDTLCETIKNGFKLLDTFKDATKNEVYYSYIAFINELLHDHVYNGEQDKEYEAITRAVDSYRNISSSNKPVMCRLLTKAALSACCAEKYMEGEKFIAEAEELMRDCDLDNLDNCIALGELYSFKGMYIEGTPLKWPDNYDKYSRSKTIDAFNKAQHILDRGITYNPANFEFKLLKLYQNKLICFKKTLIINMKDALDTCQYIIGLMYKLININNFVFTWRAIDAYMEVTEVLSDIYFSRFYHNEDSLEELGRNYNTLMSQYSEMESLLEIYKKTDLERLSDYLSKIGEARRTLNENYHAAQN